MQLSGRWKSSPPHPAVEIAMGIITIVVRSSRQTIPQLMAAFSFVLAELLSGTIRDANNSSSKRVLRRDECVVREQRVRAANRAGVPRVACRLLRSVLCQSPLCGQGHDRVRFCLNADDVIVPWRQVGVGCHTSTTCSFGAERP